MPGTARFNSQSMTGPRQARYNRRAGNWNTRAENWGNALELTWEAWFTLAVIGGVFITLVRNMAPPDVAMLSAAVLLGLVGILETNETFMGFISPGVLTIGALFVVAAAIRETGGLDTLGAYLLGRTHTERGALARMAVSVVPMSAFLNNTPVVAMLVPVITSWCRNHNVSPSRLLIPLSYMAILGGTCTLIGTSTIIVVNGLMQQQRGQYLEAFEAGGEEALHTAAEALAPLGMFEVTALGVPFALIGIAYLLTLGRRLLPSRHDIFEFQRAEGRDYLIDLRVQPGCRLAGQSVQAAGLRHLPGLFLVEIVRDGITVTPVRPDEVLQEEDILTFTGAVDTIVDLERIPGLVPVADEAYEQEVLNRREKQLCEAVVAANSPVIGRNVRDADFRARYNAAIVAVHRGGQRLGGRVGDIVLQNGDTLLLQAGPHFARAHRNNPDFYLVSGVQESRSVRSDKAAIAMGLLALLVILLSFGRQVNIDIPVAAWVVAGLMIITQCISPAVARDSVEWRTLLTIAGAIAVGQALEKTGAAAAIAETLVNLCHSLGPYALVAVLYVVTGLLTECVTTQGAAVLMFPVAVSTALEVGASPRPFTMAVLFAAAASFMTPLGYQTNLMVYGPGGYKFTDYLRAGLPLHVVLVITAVILIPLFWPF